MHAPVNIATMGRPAYLLCPPFSYSTREANNVWMEEFPEDERTPDLREATNQFLNLNRLLASEGLVYHLPAPADCGLQDLVFTANLGFVPEHIDAPTAVVANFTSPPRRGETEVGVRLFEAMGYETIVSPYKFEGEAELKHLHDNVYVGGYGQRSERETYSWMSDRFGMEIITLTHTNPYLYHLDCTIFPLTRTDTLVCTEIYSKEDVKALENVTNIVDVSLEDAFSGICNSVRASNMVLNASNVYQLDKGSEDYWKEKQKNDALERIAAEAALEVAYINLDEFLKGGALLSCMVMHLNRWSYEIALL